MGQIISEGLEYIGRIDDDGYVFDKTGDRIAKISDSGYISQVGGGKVYGKFDRDGTIRDAMSNVVGRIQADGYVYIHSKRVCRAESRFLKSITPDAWDAGHIRTQSPPSSETSDSGKSGWPFGFGTTLKLIAGIALGIQLIIEMGDSLGFLGCVVAIPMAIAVVFVLCFIFKLFIH